MNITYHKTLIVLSSLLVSAAQTTLPIAQNTNTIVTAPQPKLSKKSLRKQEKLAQAAPKKTEEKEKKGWLSNYRPFGSAMRDMSYEELKTNLAAARHTNKDAAIKYVEKMIPLCADITERKNLQYDLAQLFAETDHPTKATTYYKEFATLYPGDSKVEDAEYNALLCTYNRMLSADRDQTLTKEALEIADKFLERTIFVTHRPHVLKIREECYQRLVESDLYVFNYYLKQGDYIAAQKRLEGIEKNYLALMPSLKPELLLLKHQVASEQKDTAKALELMAELDAQFPTFQATRLAHNNPQRHAVTRF